MRWLWIALVLAGVMWMTGNAQAHEGGTVRGTVHDEEGSVLPHADVQLLDAEGRSVTSTIGLGDGSFALVAPLAARYELRVRYLGYAEYSAPVDVAESATVEVDVQLEAAPIEMGEYLVVGERVYSAASSRTARELDVRIRPLRTSQDALRVAPGLFLAQHAGGGKAEQIFLRGFDADHGTDVSVNVDGMPVNMVSHGHGQGYADLHFVIAETIDQIEVQKGPYAVDRGDFATAGAVEFRTLDRLPSNLLRYEIGEFDTHSATALTQLTKEGPTSVYLAAQFAATDGPFDDPLGLRRSNLALKIHRRLENGAEFSLGTGGFTSAWDASGQVPQRAIDSGRISRFGSIDPLEGGATSRQNLNARYHAVTEDGDIYTAQAYAFRYRFKLFSNFTFYRDDAVRGDMIEQTDGRTVLGAKVQHVGHHQWGPFPAAFTVGGDVRADNLDVALWHSPDRERVDPRVDATVYQRNYAFFLQEELDFTRRWSARFGVRGDYFTFDVEDHLESAADGRPHASGYAQEGIVSPKVNVRFRATDGIDLFANYGSGFHSNDARAVVQAEAAKTTLEALQDRGASEADIDSTLAARGLDRSAANLGTLPRAQGGEVGMRARAGGWLNFAVAAWLLDLEEELVYVGDEGTTEPSGRTRRMGIDVEVRARLRPWLWLDADVNYAEGKLRDEPDGADAIPLAPRWVSYGGLTADLPSGWLGSFRYRFVDDRPANETDSVVALGSTVFDFVLRYQRGPLGASVVVENVFDEDWNEAQFDTESRLPGESEPVSELHFTPGSPRNLRFGVEYRW